jgi:hypothetical protein
VCFAVRQRIDFPVLAIGAKFSIPPPDVCEKRPRGILCSKGSINKMGDPERRACLELHCTPEWHAMVKCESMIDMSFGRARKRNLAASLRKEHMGRRSLKVLDLDLPFEEALERLIRVDPTEMPERPVRAKHKAVKRGARDGRARKAVSPGKPKSAKPSRPSAKAVKSRGRE